MALETGGSLFWRTKIDNTGLQTGAVQAKGILRTLTRSITGMDIFAGLAIGAALVFAKITKQAYNFSKEFESAMKEVQTISKAVQNDFKGISKEIIDMSKTVPDSAQKLTKALYQIVSAGYDGAKAMDILKISAELAVATVTDTFTAADALTYVMNAYGESAGTAAEISDKLFTIVRLGKVKMEELGPTISMVTGLAAQMGLSFNELAAMYAEAVKKMQPHIVTTGIRGIITAMLQVSKGTGEAADAARELGIEFDINALKAKGFKQILKDIIEATKGNEAALGRLFPNVRGLTGLLSIMTGEGEGWNKTLNEIENSLGATDKAFATMMDTTANQWAIMQNNIMAKMKPLGDSLLGIMNSIARGINQAMSGANDELSKLARSYSELTDTLQKKQSRIDDLITTVEGLRSKTELTREETTQLHAAEKALAIYYPTLGKAAEFAGASIDVLTLAKQGSYELSIKIMELELEQAEINKRRANLELAIYKRDEDEGSKEINRINKRIKFLKDVMELELTGGIQGIYTQERLNEMMDIRLEKDNEYINLMRELSIATEKRGLEEDQLKLNIEKTTNEVDDLTEALERLRESQGKPIIITPKPGELPEEKPVTILSLTDEQIKDIEDKLKYMAGQYKRYLSDVAQFGEKYVEENNAQLVEEGKNYASYLSDMATKYKDNAELSRIISDDIYEYNKAITAERKKAEEEYFNYIAEAREKELESEKDRFKTIIKNYKEGSDEYLEVVEQHNQNILDINEKYDKEIAEAKLVIFKEGLEKQIGEEDKAYKLRLEIAKKELGKEKEANKEYFEFINNKLQEITEIEEEEAKKKREILESYFESYQTTEEKIVSIHKKTTELLLLTDVKYEQDRLRSIEKQLIAEVKFDEARQEINNKRVEYGEELNNEELENYIEFLEEMKVKYSDFADAIILFNEEIAESQKQIWENIRDEIDKTVDTLHALADAVGNFDTELEGMINDLANLVSGIGQIMAGFATGGILGFAGILGGIATAISSIFNLFTVHHSDVPELEEQLHEITLELQEQQNILNQAVGTAKPEAIQNIIDLLNEQIATYNEMIEAEQEAYGQFLWFTWSETDQAKIEQWLSTIQDINAEIANLNDQYNQILTGTTASAIADAIAEGFSQGLDSAQIFADTFNEMMKKAILDAFKRTIITQHIQNWLAGFASLSEGGLTAEEINYAAQTYLILLSRVETKWEAIKAVLAAAGIDLGEAETIEDIIEQAKEAMKEIAGITEETIADAIAGGFSEGLDSAEVFADTFNDMMRRAMIDAFKKTIITQYLKNWMAQFELLSGGGLTVEEIENLAGVYQNAVNMALAQWKAMEAILDAAGIGLEEVRKTGLTGAIAGITEETAGLLAGQFQAIRINTVDILSNMENIIIINSRIADNTEYNRYLENISNRLNEMSSLGLRSIGGS